MNRAFTLIELSIVLVIIGLIVGGILVGRDLIKASEIRSQLTQMEKIQQAVNTFRGKYDNYLPGDIPGGLATKFGFTAAASRSGAEGRGDGNGELAGFWSTTAYSWNQNGENLFIWEDLTTNSKLMEGRFNTYNDGDMVACSSVAACSVYFPPAKIGRGNVIYAYSGNAIGCCPGNTGNGANFLGITRINNLDSGGNVSSPVESTPVLTVSQAYNMDKKVDDANAITGNVVAQYLGGTLGKPYMSANDNIHKSTTCYETVQNQYSINQNGGNGVNCGVSFQMK